jgi:hypothetical protein
MHTKDMKSSTPNGEAETPQCVPLSFFTVRKLSKGLRRSEPVARSLESCGWICKPPHPSHRAPTPSCRNGLLPTHWRLRKIVKGYQCKAIPKKKKSRESLSRQTATLGARAPLARETWRKRLVGLGAWRSTVPCLTCNEKNTHNRVRICTVENYSACFVSKGKSVYW